MDRRKQVNPTSKKVVITAFFALFVVLFSLNNAIAQEQKSKIALTAGLTWRSTTMNFFNLKGLRPDNLYVPYTYEKSVQGFSLNVGLQYKLTNKFKLEYYPNLRYDLKQRNRFFVGKEFTLFNLEGDSLFIEKFRSEDVKAFIVDHNVNFLFSGRKIDYGVGFTIVAKGQSITYKTKTSNNEFLSIEFNTYNAFIVVPIKKVINLEIKALYIPSGFPYNHREKYIMYSLRAYYRFKFKKKKRNASG